MSQKPQPTPPNSESISPEAIGVASAAIKPLKMNEQLLLNDSQEINTDDIEYKLEGKPSRLKPKHFVYLCTTLACLSSILLGYDIGQFPKKINS